MSNASIVLKKGDVCFEKKVMLAELEVEAEALETVDPGIVAEYREAQEVKNYFWILCKIFSWRSLCRL